MIPARGRLLVRPVESAEQFAGSRIVIPADARERLTANQFEVIAVGAFAECDDEECERPHSDEEYCDCESREENIECQGCPTFRTHPHPVRPGDWILMRARSAFDGPDISPPVRFVHQDAVLGIFNEESQ